MANEFKVKKGLIVNGSDGTILDILGSQGQLFSVTDDLSGSLFSVNDISGIPILEVFSDDTITMGAFGTNTLVVNGSNVGIGTATPTEKLSILGNITLSGSLYIDGSIYDSTSSQGTPGQVLSSTGTATQWTDVVDPNAIPKDTGTTYNTNFIKSVTQAEYDALTPNADTLYFII